MLCVDLRHHHRNIRRKAMRAVVGNNRAFRLRIRFLQRFDLFLFHINGTKYKIHPCGYTGHVRGIHHDEVLGLLWHRCGHGPAAAHGFFIRFSGRTGRSRHRCQLKPRMIFQQRDKTLPHHSCGAHNANFKFFHVFYPFPFPLLFYAYVRYFAHRESFCMPGTPQLRKEQKGRLANRQKVQYNGRDLCTPQRNVPAVRQMQAFRHCSQAALAIARPSAVFPFRARDGSGDPDCAPTDENRASAV